ncbi:unnamed protein product, partial [Brenthis ino]
MLITIILENSSEFPFKRTSYPHKANWRKHGHLPRLRELENQPLESRRLIRAGSSFCGRGTAGVWGASRLKWLLGGANSNYATCEQMDCALPTTWIDLLAHGETLRSYI